MARTRKKKQKTKQRQKNKNKKRHQNDNKNQKGQRERERKRMEKIKIQSDRRMYLVFIPVVQLVEKTRESERDAKRVCLYTLYVQERKINQGERKRGKRKEKKKSRLPNKEGSVAPPSRLSHNEQERVR